ncbi:hypothetical protein FRB99_003509 [Tulasnella sp. 403]|nr:hypothetical protein FRB99_003509 [Tulasnella sp. 403]
MMVSTFLSVLDFTSVAMALPTIVKELHGTDFVWIGSAFALGSTAFLPMLGGLAQIFGRRPVVLGSLAFFGLGSLLAGAAQNMNMTIAARNINPPLTALAMILVFFFLRMKTPEDEFKSKMVRMGWMGNLLVVVATTITVIALTWAGIKYPWSSYKVLVPLILGLLGLVAFFLYEARFAKEPVVPPKLFSNRTSLFGPGQAGSQHIRKLVYDCANVNEYLPVPQLPFKVYRPQNFVGWAFMTLGVGLSLLKASSPKGEWVAFQIIEGMGIGMLFSVTTFPVLAALPVSETAHALAVFTFLRPYAQTWGVTIGSTILQNELKKKLPASFLSAVNSHGAEIACAAIP